MNITYSDGGIWSVAGKANIVWIVASPWLLANKLCLFCVLNIWCKLCKLVPDRQDVIKAREGAMSSEALDLILWQYGDCIFCGKHCDWCYVGVCYARLSSCCIQALKLLKRPYVPTSSVLLDEGALIWIFELPQLLTIISSLFSHLVYSYNLPLNELPLPPVTSKSQKMWKRNRSAKNDDSDLSMRYFLSRIYKSLEVETDYKFNMIL